MFFLLTLPFRIFFGLLFLPFALFFGLLFLPFLLLRVILKTALALIFLPIALLCAFLGLAFSTLLVHFASLWSEAALVTNAANLTAFGSLWVIKYLVLDALMFGHNHHAVEETVLA